MKITHIRILLLIVVLGWAGTANAASLRDGLAAYKQGNYSKAVSILLPLSKEGNAIAQNHMGLMRANGKGVKRNDKKAVYWFKKASKNGYDKAKQNLAYMRANGRGITGGTSGVTEEYEDCDE